MPILEKERSVYPPTLLVKPPVETDAGERHWWVIFTRSRQEKALARDLLRHEIPFFLPLVTRQNYIRNRIVESHLPLFGGYVFLYGNEYERLRALTTNRIVELLAVDDQLTFQEDLRQLNHLIELGAPLTVEKRLQPGRRVRVKSGVMRGLQGTVVHRRGQTRLIIAIEFLQNGVSLEIGDFMVEPV